MNTIDDLYNSSNETLNLVERNIVPQGIALCDPVAVAKSSREDLITLATEIQKADKSIRSNTYNKLQVIAEQIRFLQKQAENILLEAERNTKLHHVPCNFVKQLGHIYHLYQRESGQLYFSMLSPEEWGNTASSQSYKGSFRLEYDNSWTPVSQMQEKDNELDIFRKFLPINATTNEFLKTVTLNTNT